MLDLAPGALIQNFDFWGRRLFESGAKKTLNFLFFVKSFMNIIVKNMYKKRTQCFL